MKTTGTLHRSPGEVSINSTKMLRKILRLSLLQRSELRDFILILS